MSSYALIPIEVNSVTTLLATAAGTFLCSSSANTLNQIFEAPLDAQMSRTRSRPLARGTISTNYATVFASLTGLSGSILLGTVVNPTTAIIAISNLLLYAFIYTPLKRISIINTWVGSLVGSLPALMGSTAAGASLLDPASWLTAGLLYFWQFPHFNSLAHTLRRDYSKAGYQMMANLNPALNARVSLRYAILAVPLTSWLIPHYGLTTWTFGLLSWIPHLALIIPAFRFWIATPNGPMSNFIFRYIESSSSSNRVKMLSHSIERITERFQSKFNQQDQSKKLFWASLIHLPTLLILMMACRPSPTELDSHSNSSENRKNIK